MTDTYVVAHIDGQVVMAGEYPTRRAAAAGRHAMLALPNCRQGPDELTVREITEMDRYVFAASNVAQTRGPCVLSARGPEPCCVKCAPGRWAPCLSLRSPSIGED